MARMPGFVARLELLFLVPLGFVLCFVFVLAVSLYSSMTASYLSDTLQRLLRAVSKGFIRK